jgi:peptide deformylase
MALLKIARMGHPVLLRPATPVEDPTALPVRRLIGHMLETMRDADGIGLAAPQVYQSVRLILFLDAETRDDAPDRAPIALINPELEPLDEDLEFGLEGCLSIPGLRGVVPRHARIGYRGLAPDGRTIEREAGGLHARVVQHEVDHLNGILFPMRMPDLRQLAFETELRHLAVAAAEPEAPEPDAAEPEAGEPEAGEPEAGER